MPFPSIAAAFGGFIAGVLVNLLADYLPARRFHFLAKASPFVTAGGIPALPAPFPRRGDGRPLPFYLWSGWIARLRGVNGFSSPHWPRRLLTELALALVYPWLVNTYNGSPNLPFFLVYAPALILIVIIDIEYRWIMWETIWPVALIGILENLIAPRWPLAAVLRGCAYTLLIMVVLYVLGIVFGQGMGALRGRAVGRTVFGLGDVRLAVLGGLLVGWPQIGFALLIMVFSGALGALIFITDKLARTRRYRAFSAIPYGPYVAAGIAVMLFAPWTIGDLLGALFG